MKRCSACHRTKANHLFGRLTKAPHQRRSACHRCDYKRKIEHNAVKHAWLRAYRASKKCKHCPERNVACIDFHHVNPKTKTIKIADAIRNRGWSIRRIKQEIDTKCIPLCSNCHRKHHAKERAR